MANLYFPLTVTEDAFLSLTPEAQREIAALFEPQPVAGGGGGGGAAPARPVLQRVAPIPSPAVRAPSPAPQTPGAPAPTQRVVTRYPNAEEADVGPGIYPPVWRFAPAASPVRRRLSFHDAEEGVGAGAPGAAAAAAAPATAGQHQQQS